MRSTFIKAVLMLTLAPLMAFPSMATSLPMSQSNHDAGESQPVYQKSGKSNSGVVFYDYPDVPEANVTQTGVLFFYTKDLLEYYDGDVTKIHAFVEQSIEINNVAFERGGIALRRVVAGVLPMPEQFVDEQMYTSDMGSATKYFGWAITGTDRYFDYYETNAQGQRELKSGQKSLLDEKYGQYGASYYVALARRYLAPNEDLESKYNWVGLAIRGGELSVVTPYDNEKHTVTVLSHELGHNDGLRHNSGESYGTGHMGPYAAGAFCDNNYSIMDSRGFSYNDDHFFSDPNHTDASTDEACGELEVADSAMSYRAVIDAGWVSDKESVFENLRDMNVRKGYASIQFDDVSFNEAQGSITGVVIWEGLSDGDHASVEVVVSDYMDTSVSDFSGAASAHVSYQGAYSTPFTINVLDDDVFEIDKRVSFTLRHPNGVVIDETMAEATVSIVSDDAGNPGIFGFDSASYRVEEGHSVTIKITRTDGADGDITLRLVSEDGSAVAGEDYVAVSTELTFLSGETEKLVTFRPSNDSADENSETLTLRLVNDNAHISAGEATVTILNKSEVAPENPSPESGGGSMGVSALALVFAIAIRRRMVR